MTVFRPSLFLSSIFQKMNKISKKEQVVLSLSNIKTELDKLGLWSNGRNRPNEIAFLSGMPFCMNTMEFHQWIEFVLYPRMMEIVNSDNPLPERVLIHTYAQEIYRGRWQEYKDLIKTLMEFDKIFDM